MIDLPVGLMNTHEAMAEAAAQPQQERGAMSTYTFRIHDDIRTQMEAAAATHGTSFAAFLRSCCDVFLREYKS